MSMKIFPRQAVTAYIQTKICLFFAITAISGAVYADRTIALGTQQSSPAD